MRKIEIQILNSLAKSKKSLWELLDESHCTLRDFVDSINGLFDNGLIGSDGNTLYITDKGLEKINKKILGFESKTCDKCEGKGIIFDGKFNDVFKKYRQITKDRVQPDVNYFQGYMHEYDVIARVALMDKYGDLANKSFVLVGDDDLLSIALALTELPSRILVLDIDERIGDFIRNANKEYGFDIEFRKYDVANPLPKELVGKFDVFSSEPLETLSGLKAFIGRGVACLKENGVGYFGLTRAEASLKKWIAIERFLLRMNCIITDIISNFSKYWLTYKTASYENFTQKLKFPVAPNPGIPWYKSYLFRFEAFGKPKLVISPEKYVKITSIDRRDDITHPSLYSKKRVKRTFK